MPRMADEQTWIILTSEATISDRELASQLGLTLSAVHGRRWTLRTKGWTCRVRFASCLLCGDMLTMPPSQPRTDRPYHPGCRQEADRRNQREFYARQSLQQLAHERKVTQAAVANMQEESLARAVSRGAPWTESEDAYLEANLHRTARELAADLNRSYYGAESRLKRMRKEKRI